MTGNMDDVPVLAVLQGVAEAGAGGAVQENRDLGGPARGLDAADQPDQVIAQIFGDGAAA